MNSWYNTVRDKVIKMKHPKSYDSDEKTRKRMSRVHLKGGKAEVLPGSPDIVLTKYKIAIFVDGEFWHGKDWEERKKRLKRNREYWIEKIEENMKRDKRNDALLEADGWYVIHFWEKMVLKETDYCVEFVKYIVRSRNK